MNIHDKDLQICVRTAKILSIMSNSGKLRVGSVIYDVKKRNIMGIGYNGTVPGSDNIMEIDNVTLPGVIHAEVNSINKLSWFTRKFNKNLILVVTHTPCLSCSMEIVEKTKIRTVYYLDNYGDGKGLKFLRENNVEIKRILER